MLRRWRLLVSRLLTRRRLLVTRLLSVSLLWRWLLVARLLLSVAGLLPVACRLLRRGGLVLFLTGDENEGRSDGECEEGACSNHWSFLATWLPATLDSG